MKIAILGAGPAGLTAAKLLTDLGQPCEVFERDRQVGGLAKTPVYKGYRVDIGGHRFFTKIPWVNAFWKEILGEDFLEVPRLSRIYYDGRFYHYPLRGWDTLKNLGIERSLLSLLSYLKAQAFPRPNEETLEDYIVNRFGYRLYRTFFKSYTEKVWGIPCREIRSEWAAQRIRGLSFVSAALNSIGLGNKQLKTLIDEFNYPRLGAGMLWERVQQLVQSRGAHVHLATPAIRLLRDGSRIVEVEVGTHLGRRTVMATHFLSSLPLRNLIHMLDPPAPLPVRQAAQRLRYRDFITVNLVIRREVVFPDNWIYIHNPGTKVARIQNYKNWSSHMVPEPGTTSLGLEFFCFEGDELWSRSDAELIELAKKELRILKLAGHGEAAEGCVFRETQAYPMYNLGFREDLAMIRGYLSQFQNLQTMGRNGLHRYNNQDHSMFCARLAVDNLLGASHNLWDVNVDDEYLEEVRAGEATA
ncbi:MAG: NAD(P)/FAD-dependent oxidoreductase [Acidobacteria bacterium]|nr:NAD(P)/FAD-dependent oxidoreductase [Acidobacteriota bacterium]